MAWLGSWLFAMVAGACDTPRDLSALVVALDEADRALAVLDAAGFDAAVARAEETLPCLAEPVTPPLAASVHRAVGLRAFGSRDPLAAPAFAAARRISPDPQFPSTQVPPESPVNEAWTAVSLEGVVSASLPTPAEGWIHLDGQRTVERPVDLPVVFQRFTSDGRIADTEYLRPGSPAPSYPIAGAVAGVVAPVPAPKGKKLSLPALPGLPDLPAVPEVPKRTLVLSTAASCAATVTLWGLSAYGQARYLDTDRNPVPDDRLDGLRARTNALATTSVIGAGLCTASGALLAVTW
jgi:hypothetical protein